MADFSQRHPKINFLQLQADSIDTGESLDVYLFAGSETSISELADCKSQLEILSPSSAKIFKWEDTTKSIDSKIRSIGIILESQVTIESSFFENLELVFKYTDTFCAYSDFYHENGSGVFVEKLPAWSPIRFESVDYLGSVLAFDLGVFSKSNIDAEVSRISVIDFAIANELRFSRVPSVLYKCKPYFKPKKTLAKNLPVLESVSVIIPTQGLSVGHESLLEKCVKGLVNQVGGSSIELVVVADEGYDQRVIANVKEMLPKNFTFKLIEFNESFNFSRKCNLGASQATGQVIVFLNDDVELRSPEGISQISRWSLVEGVGAVGSQLQFPDGSIQHAGITLWEVKPRNSYLDQFPRVTDLGDLEVPHEVTGVTGACLAISRNKFDSSGGWNEELPNSYNDVDLCLRLNAMGLQSVVLNDLKIVHDESSSRNSEFDVDAFKVLKDLWSDELRSESYLRSAQANGDYQGPWGSHHSDRTSLERRYIAYTLHLIKKYGMFTTFQQLFSRISGKSYRIFNVTRHEYL